VESVWTRQGQGRLGDNPWRICRIATLPMPLAAAYEKHDWSRTAALLGPSLPLKGLCRRLCVFHLRSAPKTVDAAQFVGLPLCVVSTGSRGCGASGTRRG
jgi:hypothetical protein